MLLTCKSLKSMVDDALKQTYEDLIFQKGKADHALDQRIRETKDSKAKMEEQVAKVTNHFHLIFINYVIRQMLIV